MSIERLKTMKDTFMCAVESQMHNLTEVDAEELGEVVDMIKDLSEAIYYCEVAKAMEESEKHVNGQQQTMMYQYPMPYNEEPMYYGGRRRDPYEEKSGNTNGRDMPRMYYNGSPAGGGRSGNGGQTGNSSGSSNGSGSNSGGDYQYFEREFPDAFQDGREGRSPRSRRMYMEAKETKQDKTIQMRELEKYMQELAQDITEMIEDASQEERQYLSKKISALSTKLIQNNG